QVPDADLDAYAGRYDAGYDAIKRERMARMKEIGRIDRDLEVNPGSGLFLTWAELSDEEKRREARKMELYAAMIERMDLHLGRALDSLHDPAKRDHPVVLFLSDNGANPKQPEFYQPNTPEQIASDFDNSMANMRREGSFV